MAQTIVERRIAVRTVGFNDNAVEVLLLSANGRSDAMAAVRMILVPPVQRGADRCHTEPSSEHSQDHPQSAEVDLPEHVGTMHIDIIG